MTEKAHMPSNPCVYVKTFVFPWEVEAEKQKIKPVFEEEEEDTEDDNISCLSDGTAKLHVEETNSALQLEKDHKLDHEDPIIEEEEEEGSFSEEYDEDEDKGIDILESELEIAMASRDEEALLSLLEITNHLIASSPKKKRTPKKNQDTSDSAEETPALTYENFDQENSRSPNYQSLSKKFESILNHSYHSISTRKETLVTIDSNQQQAIVTNIPMANEQGAELDFSAAAASNCEEEEDFWHEKGQTPRGDMGDDYYCDLSSEFDTDSVAFQQLVAENNIVCESEIPSSQEDQDEDQSVDGRQGSVELEEKESMERPIQEDKDTSVHPDILKLNDNDIHISEEDPTVASKLQEANNDADRIKPQSDQESMSDAAHSTPSQSISTPSKEGIQPQDAVLNVSLSLSENKDSSTMNDLKSAKSRQVNPPADMVTPIRRKKKPPPRSSLRKFKGMNSIDSVKTSSHTPVNSTPSSTSSSEPSPGASEATPANKVDNTNQDSDPKSDSHCGTENPIGDQHQSPDCVAGFDDLIGAEQTPKKYDDLDTWINDMMKHSKPTPKLKSKNLNEELNKEKRRREFFISKEDINEQAKLMMPLILKKHQENERRVEEAARRMVPLILKEHEEIQKRERNRKIRERFGRKVVRLANEFYNDIQEEPIVPKVPPYENVETI